MMRLFLFLMMVFMAGPVKAAEFEYGDFAKLPVQHEGRIKPMDTFARTMMENFSGHESLHGMSAEAWMAETLFGPFDTMNRPLFRVFKPELLGLPAHDDPYFSGVEIGNLLAQKAGVIAQLEKTDQKNWSTDQRELMRLSESFFLYTQLRNSFVHVHPLLIPAPLQKDWAIKEGSIITYRDYQRLYENKLEARIKKMTRKNGYDPARFTADQTEMVDFFMSMKKLGESGATNIFLRIVPGTGPEWFSPWTLTEAGEGSPQAATYLEHWRAMAGAYQSGDSAAWQNATREARAQAKSFTDARALDLEILYNKLHPLLFAGILYFAALLGAVFFSLRGHRYAWVLSLSALWAGGVLHTAAIGARIIILNRAPVGTLYESILFVALICVVVALILEHIRKDGQGTMIGALAALLLLFIAGSFADGDTMKMLVAVLNTNFWLSTHVLCITMGYAWCVIASLLAHTWLIRAAMGKSAGDLVTMTKIIALTGLLFTAVGTILGGIWADQSWGRFWGWDPKENGALLIVLWLIWVFHGQLGGHLKMPAFMSGLAALSVVVALAWFGVNLLSVGLHSYGFITGVAASLGAFCAAETLLIGWLWYRAENRRRLA